MKCHHHEPDISPRYLNVSFKTGNTEIIKHTFAKIPLGGGNAFFNKKTIPGNQHGAITHMKVTSMV